MINLFYIFFLSLVHSASMVRNFANVPIKHIFFTLDIEIYFTLSFKRKSHFLTFYRRFEEMFLCILGWVWSLHLWLRQAPPPSAIQQFSKRQKTFVQWFRAMLKKGNTFVKKLKGGNIFIYFPKLKRKLKCQGLSFFSLSTLLVSSAGKSGTVP